MSFQGCKYFKDVKTEPLGRNLLELLSFSAGHRSLLSSSLLSLSLLSFSALCRDKRQHGLWFIMCDRSTCDICRLLTVLSELHCSFCYSHTFFVLHSVYQVPQVPSLFCVILRFVFFSSVYFLKRLGKGSNNQNGNLRCFSSMKGGSRVPDTYSEKWIFKNHLEPFPDCEYVFCTLFGLYIMYK